jgi:hypothetical protein
VTARADHVEKRSDAVCRVPHKQDGPVSCMSAPRVDPFRVVRLYYLDPVVKKAFPVQALLHKLEVEGFVDIAV